MFGKKEKKQVTSFSGRSFWVDISDRACSKFGFRHDSRVKVKVHGDWLAATIMGVSRTFEGCNPFGRKVMWISLDDYQGRVTYFRSLVRGENIRPA
jgi:hypothetical protein